MDSPARRPRGIVRVRGRTWLALSGAALLLVIYLGISLFSADQLTKAHNDRERLDPLRVSQSATAWSVKTRDGLTLRGWYHPTESRRHLVVLVHGLWGSWHQMAGLGRDLHELGYDVLLFDLRGHGRSDPSRVFMGRRERGDLRAVLAWAKAQGFPPERIGWVGNSMGASTILMEAARNPAIKVAVVDSPFGNLPELLDDQLARHSHLPRFFNPGILTAARFAYGVRTDDLIPVRSARLWGQRPLLLIHGTADTTVPLRQALQIARAAGPKCESLVVPGVEHVQAYRADRARYVSRVDAFFQRNLMP